MNQDVARGIAIVVIVLGCLWILPLVLLLIIDPPRLRQLPFALAVCSLCSLPGAIAIWRAVRYLRETKPRVRPRRGFTVLPPK
jgi:uncharacterized membrane protein YqjE